MRNQKASAFQIIATVGIIIAAFLLLMIMTVEKVKKDTISVQQYGKEYTGIIAEKGPEYAEKSSVQGAYQSIYETGPRGGYTKESVTEAEHLDVYGNMKVAVWSKGEWINKKDRMIDTTQMIIDTIRLEQNMSSVILDYLKNYTKRYGSTYAINLTTYNNTSIQITDEDIEYFTVALMPESEIEKKYKVGGENATDAATQSARKDEVNIRYFQMYDMMEMFMGNNLMINAGWGAKNILNARISKTPSKPAADTSALQTPIPNTAKQTGGKTNYGCAGIGSCAGKAAGTFTSGAADYCTAACTNLDSVTVVNYTACPQLTVPSVGTKIRYNIISGIKYINQLLNSQTPSSENIVCTRGDCTIKMPGATPPTPPIDVSQNYYGAGWLWERVTYKDGRYRWDINATGGKVDFLGVTWQPADDRYTVLWWNQTESTGKATYPDGSDWLTDNPAAANGWNEAAFPPGMAACDSVNRQNCHTIYTGWCAEYHRKKPSSSASCPDITSWCADWRTGTSNYYERTTAGTLDDPTDHISSDMEVVTWNLYEEYYTRIPKLVSDVYYCCPGGTLLCGTCGSGYGSGTCPYGASKVPTACTKTVWECKYNSKKILTGGGHMDFDGLAGTGKTTTATGHCDITYTMQGKFKYRAETEILSTLTDMSALMPVYNGTKTIQENPKIRAAQNLIITEEPACGDTCCDLDAEENLPDSRYYCAADCTPPYKYCPVKKNTLAQKTYYS